MYPKERSSVSPGPNAYFFHFRASRLRKTMTSTATSFVVVTLFCTTFVDRLRTLAMVPSSRSVRLLGSAIHPCNLQCKRGCLAKRPIHLSRILRNSHLAWEWCVSFFMIFLCFSLCVFFADFVLVFSMILCMCIFSDLFGFSFVFLFVFCW